MNGQISVSALAATPTFSPTAGGYVGAQVVTISSLSAGATIYFTTDGSTPTLSSPSGPNGLTILVPAPTANITIQNDRNLVLTLRGPNMTLYTNSLGSYAIIPGNTISDIYNATSLGPFLKSDVGVFLPTIQAWARQTTNRQAQTKAQWFLNDYNQLQ